MPSIDEFSIYILRMGFVAICVYTIMWLTVKTVVGIDTGIENIESKKVSNSGSNSFLKLLFIHPIITLFSSLITNISNGSQYFYIFLFVQVVILNFLIKQYVISSYFEAEAKGKNAKDSLSNAYTNLIFSKNGFIVKTAIGKFLAFLVYGLLYFVILVGCVVLLFMSCAIDSTFLLLFTGMITILLLIVINQYCTFYLIMYEYLVYMLNEVRDDVVYYLR